MAERDTAEKAAAEVAAAMMRVEELEGEVATLRTSSRAVMSLFQLPTKEDVLAGGLPRSNRGAIHGGTEGPGKAGRADSCLQQQQTAC